MVEEKIEEETYSLIFTSLKHPIRRSILRMLADKPLTYSEILETLNIDSGHLSYHLENLGDLTVHSNNGPYKLSSFGVAAVKLMGGVEEHTPKTKQKFKSWTFLIKVCSVILAMFLISASFHLVTCVTIESTTYNPLENLMVPLYAHIPFNVVAGETFELNATIQYPPSFTNNGFGARSGSSQNWTLSIPQLESTFTKWDEASIWLDSTFNLTALSVVSPVQEARIMVLNASSQTNETFTISICGTGFGSNQVEASNPQNLEVKIYEPKGTNLTGIFERNDKNRIDSSSSPSVPITQTGLYTFQITNNAEWDWNGYLSINIEIQHFEKPYFYWGIVGFMISMGYIVLVTAATYKTRHKTDKQSN